MHKKHLLVIISLVFLVNIMSFNIAYSGTEYTLFKEKDISILIIDDTVNSFKTDLFPSIKDYKDSVVFLQNGAFPGTVRTFLLTMGKKKILIDAGWGSGGKKQGRTLKILQEAMVNPNDITDILLTHLDVDHVSGILDKGKPLYPNATVHVIREEYEAWIERGNVRNEASVKNAREAIEAYKAKGQLSIDNWGQEVLSNITAIRADGHTPGHTVYEVSLGEKKAAFLGDLLHAADLQLRHPECNSVYDHNPERAAASRKGILSRYADKNIVVFGAHIRPYGVVHAAHDGFFIEED